MTSKNIPLLIICLALASVTMSGCGQVPTPGPTVTLEATLEVDSPPSPTSRPTDTPTPTPSPTAAAVTPPMPTPTDEPEPDEPRESGIQGQVLRGPTCAGPIRIDDPCPDEPFSATFHVLDSQGNQVTSFYTGEDGCFHVLLAPGEYTIVPDKSAPLMSPGNQRKTVAVKDQELTLVTLVFDTGIR